MGFFPKTNVVGFGMMNNFRVQSFSSCNTKMGEKFEFWSVEDIFKCTQVLNFIFQMKPQMKSA